MDDGIVGDGPHLFGEITHVPLMFVGPGVPNNRRVATAVGHADILPTLLSLVGVAPPGGRMGRSVAALIHAEDAIEDVPHFSEAWLHFGTRADKSRAPVRQPTLSVRLGNDKLIRNGRVSDPAGFAYQSFDLGSDPLERHDRYAERREDAGRLRQLLEQHMARTEEMKALIYQDGALLGRVAPSARARARVDAPSARLPPGTRFRFAGFRTVERLS